MNAGPIRVRGCRVHNLQNLDIDIARGQLTVVCGVSGSGKTTLALDTLYAEGQRRYIESFSAYTRQFLQRLDKPDCDRIDGIPPAVAVTRVGPQRTSRSTVGTATEIADHLRLMMAKIGTLHCFRCQRLIRARDPGSIASDLQQLPPGTRLMLGFEVFLPSRRQASEILLGLQQDGFQRLAIGDAVFHLAESERSKIAKAVGRGGAVATVIVDRLTSDGDLVRATESLETVTAEGDGKVILLVEPQRYPPGSAGGSSLSEERARSRRHADPPRSKLRPSQREGSIGNPVKTASESRTTSSAGGLSPSEGRGRSSKSPEPSPEQAPTLPPSREGGTAESRSTIDWLDAATEVTLDGRQWLRVSLSNQLRCEACDIDFPEASPRLFNFNLPLGACPRCEGFGDVVEVDMDLVVPDPSLTLRQGAIAPWNTPSYQHELEELLALADEYDLPVDVPYAQLTDAQRKLIEVGVPKRRFGGLNGFFAWLERKKYKMHIRVLLSRYRSYRQCPVCQGQRLRPEALAYRLGGLTMAEIADLTAQQATEFFARLPLTEHQAAIVREPLRQMVARLGYLDQVGLSYLQIGRTLRTLSGGENQRVALGSTLGSSLVNMLYVLDEPTAGLHPCDVDRLRDAILQLRDRGNTVVAVEHEESVIRAADQLIEIGPGAGRLGGKLVYQGDLAGMVSSPNSLTGDFLTGRRGTSLLGRTPRTPRSMLTLQGASGHNLQGIDVEFPLGVLCLVTGVSGSGKSSLVQDTLYGAVQRALQQTAPAPLPYRGLKGVRGFSQCQLVDQSPVSRSPRSNPVTFVKAFDAIRKVFSDTVDARTRNLGPGHFSFNSAAGRCDTCEGDGQLTVDMQFLADVSLVCPACQGTRYREAILQVRYRERNIAEVLALSVREAIAFFRGHEAVQQRLQPLVDVGLDYLALGQSATTLSSGEAQRLKLAGFLASASRRPSLFILDEPTTGLHMADIVRLYDCFDALIAEGHSLVVVEHNLQLIAAADYIIDIGPGAGDAGGHVVAAGTPAELCQSSQSKTGQKLAEFLQQRES